MKFNVLTMLAAVALLNLGAAQAQEDGSDVVLPLEAQNCVLPVAPTRIPDPPTYDDLVTAKSNITQFQEDLMSYRACLDSSADMGTLTDGNQTALTQSHNYSVEMEERVAQQFNEAIRAYKAAQAEGGN